MNSKQSTNKMSAGAVFFHKHWWKIGVIILLVSSLAFLGYNKYLDQQNVNNMKQLLADFEQLKTDVEAETGEKLVIEATCGSVGKFATSYSCDLVLIKKNSEAKLKTEAKYLTFIDKHINCEILKNGTGAYNNALNCVMTVRSSNEADAEKIFYDYDTSPGSSI